METIRLIDQQSLRIAELPEDYWVIGVASRRPRCASPPDSSCASSRTAARPQPRAGSPNAAPGEAARLGGVLATTPYTRVFG